MWVAMKSRGSSASSDCVRDATRWFRSPGLTHSSRMPPATSSSPPTPLIRMPTSKALSSRLADTDSPPDDYTSFMGAGRRSWGTCAPRRPSHGCDVLDRDRVSVDSDRVQGLELGLGCSAHQAKGGAVLNLWPQPGGYSRGEQLGRVVHQHGVVAGRRQTGTGLGVDIDAQQAAPAALQIPRCILDDLARAQAAQPGDLQVAR